MNSKIIGCGAYLPKKIVTNKDLESSLDTSDEWIKTRTGIRQRYVSSENEGIADMAFSAASFALEDANIKSNEIDLIINSTTSPDNVFPASAAKLAAFLNLKAVPAFDLQAVCSGFIYGLNIADNLIKAGQYRTILLTCAEKMSEIIDWSDRNTAILFGDGAAAVILQRNTVNNQGILDSIINADGNFYNLLYANKHSRGVFMNGREVFKHAVDKMVASVENILMKNNLSVDDVDYFVPHQANLRIINSISQKLGIASNKIVTVIEKHANCSAASIPLAFTELKLSGKLKPGDIIVFTAFGGGFTWGSAIIKW